MKVYPENMQSTNIFCVESFIIRHDWRNENSVQVFTVDIESGRNERDYALLVFLQVLSVIIERKLQGTSATAAQRGSVVRREYRPVTGHASGLAPLSLTSMVSDTDGRVFLSEQAVAGVEDSSPTIEKCAFTLPCPLLQSLLCKYQNVLQNDAK